VVLGGGVGWVVGDRAARQEVQEREAEEALDQAASLLEQGQWREAAAWARRARVVLAGGQARPALYRRLEEIEADLKMVDRIAEVRIQRSAVRDEHFDWESVDPGYTQAFAEYGIDVDALSAEDAATAISARHIRLELALALDDWAHGRRESETRERGWKHLLAVAKVADADELRNRLRRAIETRPYDRAALARLASSDQLANVPAPTLVMLGKYLKLSGQIDRAVHVLRQAQRRYPTDFWINHNLGYSLMETSRWQEALPFYTAALALRPQSPGLLINLSTVLRKQKDHAWALAVCEEAIRLKPDYAMAWHNRALAYSHLGRPDKAVGDFSRALELRPKWGQAYVLRGREYLVLRQRDKARADFATAVKLMPLCAFRGYAWLKLGQSKKALADYAKVVEREPGNADAWCGLGLAYGNLRQHQKAVDASSEAIQIDPDYAMAWYCRGHAHGHLGRHYKALGDLSKAIKLDPTLEEAWHARGTTHGLLDHFADAITDFSRAIELRADFAAAWYGRGVCHRRLKQYPEALRDFSRAIHLKPDYAEAWGGRGYVHTELDQLAKAVADYSKVVELNPRDAEALRSRGNVYRRLGQEQDALKDYQKAIELSPTSPIAQNALAWFLATCADAHLRNPKLAVALAKKAAAVSPTGIHWNTLGVCHYRVADYKAALTALQKAVQLRNGGNGSDWFFLAMVHWQLNHKDQAQKAYERAVGWMAKHAPQDEQQRRFRTEAAELLGIKKTP
jgi:tetratricopeptide (TPR) repeat protein